MMIHIVTNGGRPYVAFDMSKGDWDELDKRWNERVRHPGPIPEAPVPPSILDYSVPEHYLEAAKKHYGRIRQHAADWSEWFKRCAWHEDALNELRVALNLDSAASPARIKVAWLISSGYTAEEIRYV